MGFRKVKIKSIEPWDKFNIVGMECQFAPASLEEGGNLCLIFPKNEGSFTTSAIQEIIEVDNGIITTTRNSVYELEFTDNKFIASKISYGNITNSPFKENIFQGEKEEI